MDANEIESTEKNDIKDKNNEKYLEIYYSREHIPKSKDKANQKSDVAGDCSTEDDSSSIYSDYSSCTSFEESLSSVDERNKRKKIPDKAGATKNKTGTSKKRKRLESNDRKHDTEPPNKKLKTEDPEQNKNGSDKEEAKVNSKDYKEHLDFIQKKYGSNIYCSATVPREGLRPIYIDGSNVAFCHGKDRIFSVKGIEICLEYFKKRGHKVVVAFVPNFRLRKGETNDHFLINRLSKEKSVIVTPTLYINDERRSPYDDWYIVQSAAVNEGIIVSRDNFQDIVDWNKELRHVVEERRLVPTFVDDMLIFPVDPHGNRKNDLESFLRY